MINIYTYDRINNPYYWKDRTSNNSIDGEWITSLNKATRYSVDEMKKMILKWGTCEYSLWKSIYQLAIEDILYL